MNYKNGLIVLLVAIVIFVGSATGKTWYSNGIETAKIEAVLAYKSREKAKRARVALASQESCREQRMRNSRLSWVRYTGKKIVGIFVNNKNEC